MGSRRVNTKIILERFKLIHGDRYDYSLVNYTNSDTKVEIICKQHGSFFQKSEKHCRGNGCVECGKIATSKSRIKQSRDSKGTFEHVTLPEGVRLIPLNKDEYALVDEEDYERVSQYNWYSKKSNKTNYAVSSLGSSGYKVFMHRFIMGIHEDRGGKAVLDHRNLIGTDNRKSNLRFCTKSQNLLNSQRASLSSSKYKGVFKSKNGKKWGARISFNHIQHHLGMFNTEEEAAIAYDAKAIELHKEFAYLNFPNN